MYLSYEEYKKFGGELTIMQFDRFSFMAEREIDNATLDKCKAMSPVLECVKRCVFELIEYISANHQSGNILPLASFSNDGYSATYVSPKSAEQSIRDIIYRYLADEDLLYCGVR